MSSINKFPKTLLQKPDPNDLRNQRNQSPAKEPIEQKAPQHTPSDPELKEFKQDPELKAFKEKIFAVKDKKPAPWWDRDPMVKEAPPTHDNMAVDPRAPKPSQMSPKDKTTKM